jgi:hypothetical protein
MGICLCADNAWCPPKLSIQYCGLWRHVMETVLEMSRYIPVYHTGTSLCSWISYPHLSIHTMYIHSSFSIFLTVYPCFAFKKYTGTSKFPFWALNRNQSHSGGSRTYCRNVCIKYILDSGRCPNQLQRNKFILCHFSSKCFKFWKPESFRQRKRRRPVTCRWCNPALISPLRFSPLAAGDGLSGCPSPPLLLPATLCYIPSGRS